MKPIILACVLALALSCEVKEYAIENIFDYTVYAPRCYTSYIDDSTRDDVNINLDPHGWGKDKMLGKVEILLNKPYHIWEVVVVHEYNKPLSLTLHYGSESTAMEQKAKELKNNVWYRTMKLTSDLNTFYADRITLTPSESYGENNFLQMSINNLAIQMSGESPSSVEKSVIEALYYSQNQLNVYNALFEDDDSKYYQLVPAASMFDDEGADVWFTIQFSKTVVVYELAVMTDTAESFSLEHRIDTSRQFATYTKGGQKKMFVNDGSTFTGDLSVKDEQLKAITVQVYSHRIADAFQASQVMLLFNAGSSSALMKVEFHYTTTLNSYRKGLLEAFSILAGEESFAIEFHHTWLVTGLQFFDSGSLTSFCLSYDHNGQTIDYSDLHTQTIFNTASDIFLKPFRTAILTFGCMNWKSSANVIVHIKGSADVLAADHTWRGYNYTWSEGLITFADYEGSSELYGTTVDGMTKQTASGKLKTNAMGADCLTRPQYCDTGFSLQMLLDSSFKRTEQYMSYLPYTRYYFKNYGRHDVADEQKFGFKSGKDISSVYTYSDLYLSASAEITHCSITIGSVKESKDNYVTRIYVLSSRHNDFYIKIRDFFGSSSEKETLDVQGIPYQTFEFVADPPELDTKQTFNITELVKNAVKEQYNDVHQLTVLFTPDDDQSPDEVKVGVGGERLIVQYVDAGIASPTVALEPVTMEIDPHDSTYYWTADFQELVYLTEIPIYPAGARENHVVHIQILSNDFFRTSDYSYVTIVDVSVSDGKTEIYKTNGFISSTKFRFLSNANYPFTIGRLSGVKALTTTYPIISAGLVEDDSNQIGTGFSLALTPDDKVRLHVADGSSLYSANVSLENVPASCSLMLTWSQANGARIYVDGELLDEDAAGAAYTQVENATNAFADYLVMFGAHHVYNTPYLASAQSLQVWRTELSAEDTETLAQSVVVEERSFPELSVPPGFKAGSDCLCSNVVCPCEVNESSTLEAVFLIRQLVTVVVTTEDYYNHTYTIPYVSEDDLNNTIVYYDNVIVDLNYVRLLAVNLTGSLSETTDECFNVEVKFSGDILSRDIVVTKEWCGTAGSAEFKLDNIANELTHELKLQSGKQGKITCLTVEVKSGGASITSDLKLVISYNPPKPGGFIHASALQKEEAADGKMTHTTLTLKTHNASRLTFKMKFGGGGFVGLAIFGESPENNTQEEIKWVWRNEALDTWIDVQLNVDGYENIVLDAIKNGNGSGYVLYDKFILDNLEAPPSLSSAVDNTELTELGLPIPKLFLGFTATELTTGENYTLLSLPTSLLYHYQRTEYVNTISIPHHDLNEGITVAFWITTESEFSIHFEDVSITFDSNSGSFTGNSKSITTTTPTQDRWDYVVIKYDFKCSIVSFHLNFKEAWSESISTNRVESFSIEMDDGIANFQLYEELLPLDFLEGSKADLSKANTSACSARVDNCTWCNLFTGEWQRYPQPYVLKHTLPCFNLKKRLNMTVYQNFDFVQDDKFLLVVGDETISTSDFIQQDTEGMFFKGLRFESFKTQGGGHENGGNGGGGQAPVTSEALSEETANSFSLWLKPSCLSYEIDQTFLATDTFALVCRMFNYSREDTENPIVLYTNEAYYSVAAKAGMWFNFAWVLNGSSRFYLDGQILTLVVIEDYEGTAALVDGGVHIYSPAGHPIVVDELILGASLALPDLYTTQFAASSKGNVHLAMLKQHIIPNKFYFTHTRTWNTELDFNGNYLYELQKEQIELELNEFYKDIEEILYVEVVAMERSNAASTQGTLNFYYIDHSSANKDLIIQAAWSSSDISISTSGDTTLERSDLLRCYSARTNYSVVENNRFYSVLSFDAYHQPGEQPVSSIEVKVTCPTDGTFEYTAMANNADRVYVGPLEPFTMYEVAVRVETLTDKYSVWADLPQEFKTKESVAVEAPGLVLSGDEAAKILNVTITTIADESWEGVSHSYIIKHWLMHEEEDCNSYSSEHGAKVYVNEILYANLTHPGLSYTISVDTAPWTYRMLCVVTYATTQGGSGLGVRNYTTHRTQPGAPEEAVTGLEAVFIDDLVSSSWQPITSSVETWNFNATQGNYFVDVFYNGLEGNGTIQVNTTNTTFECYVPENTVVTVRVAPVSVDYGDFTETFAVVQKIKAPSFIPEIAVTVEGSRSASVFIGEFDPFLFRGNSKSFSVNFTAVKGHGISDSTNKMFYPAVDYMDSVEHFNERSKINEKYIFDTFIEQETKTSYTWHEFIPDTVYEVSVCPINEVGAGICSHIAVIHTYSDYPTCYPLDLSLHNTSSTSMNASWSAIDPLCQSGAIVSYNLMCNGSRSGNDFHNTQELVLSNELIELQKYEVICCNVRLVNVNGTGPQSLNRCAYTDQDYPEMAPALVETKISSQDANFSFANNLIDPQLNGIPLTLVISLKKIGYAHVEGHDFDLDFVNLSSYSLSSFGVEDEVLLFKLPGLEPSMNYEAEFFYTNSKGDGPISDLISFTTHEQVPDPPASIFHNSSNVREIVVNWTSITEEWSRGVITHYVLCEERLYSNESMVGNVTCYEHHNLTHRQMLLHVGRRSINRISIAACTSAGCGNYSVIISSPMNYTNGVWQGWTEWSECSVTCGDGLRTRTRECTPPSTGGDWCGGDNTSYTHCNLKTCSGFVLGKPGETNCSAVCERQGLLCLSIFLKFYNSTVIFNDTISPAPCNRTEHPYYDNDFDPSYNSDTQDCRGYTNIPDEVMCEGVSTHPQTNYSRLCNCIAPHDYGFGNWAQWGFCHPECGPESKMQRQRICYGECSGESIQAKSCDLPCPGDGEWGSWSNFPACNVSCGYGYRIRERQCDNPPAEAGGTPCQGISVDEEPECNAFPCPVHGNYSEWTDWAICNVSCGEGHLIRRRYCDNPTPAYKGQECNGSDFEVLSCIRPACQEVDVNVEQRVDAEWDWTCYDLNSDCAKNFSATFQHAFFETSSSLEDTGASINDMTINSLAYGSIIVNYTITYSHLQDEFVKFVDDVFEKGTVGGLTVLDTKYVSLKVHCPPPYNITSVGIDKRSVQLTWSQDACNDEKWIYVYYKDIDAGNDTQFEHFGVMGTGAVVSNLKTGHVYRAYLLVAMDIANCLPSEHFFFQSQEKPPARPPLSASTKSIKSTEIYVEWKDIPQQYRNGKLLGYRIKYKKYIVDEPFTVVDVQFGFNAFVLKGLTPYTLYIVEVYGFNSAGDGPVMYSMCKTIEGVPSIAVPNFRWRDMESVDWWSVAWDKIPYKYTNGVLLGYRLIYYLSHRSGLEVTGEKQKVSIDFDLYTRYYKQRNLLNYAIYMVSVAGFTAAGMGPAPEYPIRTCKCKKRLFANWIVNEPFIELKENQPGGFFFDLLQEMVVTACGTCKPYGHSQLYIERSLLGDSPRKDNEKLLKTYISEFVDISFPVYGVRGKEVAPDSLFTSLVNSPGLAMIVKDAKDINEIIINMILGILDVWPLLLISYLIAMMFGICIWFTDQFLNPDEFSLGSSLRGPMIGFWWSFVTMTTVGYGDQSPRSILARAFAMTWFLVGLILNGIIIGFITTSLTSLGMPEEFSLYNTKVAALADTYEYRTAVMKNANMTGELLFSNVSTVLDALESEEVKIGYLDLFRMLDLQSDLSDRGIKLAAIENYGTGYGFVLSGLSTVLRPDIESFVAFRSDDIAKFSASMENRLPKLVEEETGQATQDIFSADSPGFHAALKWLAILITVTSCIGLIVHCVRKRNESKVRGEETLEEAAYRLQEFIEEFREQLHECADELTHLHDSERIELNDLKTRYESKVKRHGVQEANRYAQMRNKYGYIQDQQ